MSNDTVWTKEKVSAVKRMKIAGMDNGQISKRLGISRDAIKNWLLRHEGGPGQATIQQRYNDIRRRGNTPQRAAQLLGLTASEGIAREHAMINRGVNAADASTPKFALNDDHAERCLAHGGFPHFPTDGRGNLVPVWMWPTSRAA